MTDLFLFSGAVVLFAWVLLLIGVWNISSRLKWHARVRGEWDNQIHAELKAIRAALEARPAAPEPGKDTK